MKKICCILLYIFSLHTLSLSATMLVPSLQSQMKRQEGINIENRVLAKKQLNTSKLSALKLARQSKVTMSVSNPQNKTSPQIASRTLSEISWNSTKQNDTMYSVANTVDWVDMDRVRATWNSWYTSVRSNLGLGAYTFDPRLDTTAADWNTAFTAGHWLNHHRRSPTDSYYNYSIITDWFKNRGVVGKLIWWATTTENVWYGYYRCTSSDCTDTLISSIRSTFDFFMSEKWKAYDAHYRSIVQPNFTKIGLAISLVPSENRYYMTIHYITEFE